VDLAVELFDPDTEGRLVSFKGVLWYGMRHEKPVIDDRKNHLFWHIHTRRVEKNNRKIGLGTAGLRLFEETAVEIGAQYADLRAEWIQFDTFLSSITKMAISQDWLEAHGLSAYKKKTGPDFGYLPTSVDEEDVESVLSANTEEIDQIRGNHFSEIRLYKKI
jgi:hypothetical protein